MTPGLPLNTAHAHTWAAVVSGTAWKRHILEDGGTLTAEYARGPLIFWATKLSQQTGIPDSFYSANAWNGIIGHLRTTNPKFNKDNQRVTRRLEYITASQLAYITVIVESSNIFFKSSISNSHKAEFLRRIAELLERFAEKLIRYADVQDEIRKKNPKLYVRYQLWYQLQSIATRGLISYKTRLALIRTLYRAHLTRRVKPAPRQHRIRRPLYARPRPPSAPLAPPVI